jgi:hypothetical protein
MSAISSRSAAAIRTWSDRRWSVTSANDRGPNVGCRSSSADCDPVVRTVVNAWGVTGSSERAVVSHRVSAVWGTRCANTIDRNWGLPRCGSATSWVLVSGLHGVPVGGAEVDEEGGFWWVGVVSSVI